MKEHTIKLPCGATAAVATSLYDSPYAATDRITITDSTGDSLTAEFSEEDNTVTKVEIYMRRDSTLKILEELGRMLREETET